MFLPSVIGIHELNALCINETWNTRKIIWLCVVTPIHTSHFSQLVRSLHLLMTSTQHFYSHCLSPSSFIPVCKCGIFSILVRRKLQIRPASCTYLFSFILFKARTNMNWDPCSSKRTLVWEHWMLVSVVKEYKLKIWCSCVDLFVIILKIWLSASSDSLWTWQII